jgi:hypothetical protein
MSENSAERLEKMLRSRRVEPARHDLAARIILKAQSVPQLQSMSPWQAVRQLFAEFHLPKPGYVLASVLVLGMVLGFGTEPENGQLNDGSGGVSYSYMSSDEGLL